MAGRITGRALTVLLMTLALFVAGSSVARTRAVAGPAEETAPVEAADAPRAVGLPRGGPPRGERPFGQFSDEAAMALVGTALLAVAAALRKTA